MEGMGVVSIIWNLGDLVLSGSITCDGRIQAGPRLWGFAWKK